MIFCTYFVNAPLHLKAAEMSFIRTGHDKLKTQSNFPKFNKVNQKFP